MSLNDIIFSRLGGWRLKLNEKVIKKVVAK